MHQVNGILIPQLIFPSLYQIWARSHDGHFVYYPDLLTKAFEFGRQLGLVSISKDGSSLPEIKIYGKYRSLEISNASLPGYRGRGIISLDCISCY
jgi:hypothetical protein